MTQKNIKDNQTITQQSCLQETDEPFKLSVTVEAPVSEHPREAEKVSATGAGHLQECVNTEFV